MAKEKVSKEEFYKEVVSIYNKYGDVNQKILEENSNLKVHFQYYICKLGGMKKILSELGINKTFNKYSKDEILEDLSIRLIRINHNNVLNEEFLKSIIK